LRVGNTVGAAISERRTLEGGERRIVLLGAAVMLALAALWAVFPRLLAVPGVVILGWLGLSLLWKAWRLRRPPSRSSPASLPAAAQGSQGGSA
jgi:cardiolipin synthase